MDFQTNCFLFLCCVGYLLYVAGKGVAKAANTEAGKAAGYVAASHFLRRWFR
jgi:hypothetical protein